LKGVVLAAVALAVGFSLWWWMPEPVAYSVLAGLAGLSELMNRKS